MIRDLFGLQLKSEIQKSCLTFCEIFATGEETFAMSNLGLLGFIDALHYSSSRDVIWGSGAFGVVL